MTRSTLYEDFLSRAKDLWYFKNPRRVLVACSGGPDSVALLDVIVRYAPTVQARVFICHLNHCLRGADSDEDARFVGRLAKTLGVEVLLERSDVAGLAAERRISIEAAAREARYAFFVEAARRLRCSIVFTAHTKSDNAETFLQRVIEGAGIEGLSAIPPSRLLDAGKRIYVARPLLFASRAEIEKYLASRGLEFRIDKTNLEPTYLRNRIRLEVLPKLKELNPSIEDALARAAAGFAAFEEYVSDHVMRAKDRIVAEGKGPVRAISIDELLDAKPIIAGEVVKDELILAGVEWREVKRAHVEAILALARSDNPSGRLDMPGSVSVRRQYGLIYMGRAVDFDRAERGEIEDNRGYAARLFAAGRDEARKRGEGAVPPFEVVLPVPDRVEMPDGLGWMEARLCPAADLEGFLARKSPYEEMIAADAIAGALKVRPPLPGDRFRPLGAPGERKLQDIFVDAKVPAAERSRMPVIEDDEGIVWVAGIRIADRVKVTPETRSAVLLAWLRTA